MSRAERPDRPCAIEGCDRRDYAARGWCFLHYQRWQRTGDPTKLLGRDNVRRRDSWQHGSRRGYEQGCRCFPCRIADNRYQRAWNRGQRARIPAVEVAAHIEQLVASGWTKRGIAEEADVGATTPWYIASGRVKAVNSRTAAAILSVRPLNVGPVWLDAAPLVAAIEARHEPLTSLLPDRSDQKAFYRARRDGRLTDEVADRLSVHALGRTLEELYGPAWDEQEVAA